MIGRMAKRLLPLFALWAAAACVFPGRAGKETVHTYLLSPDRTSAQTAVTESSGGAAVLLVNLPKEQAGFDTDLIAYFRRPQEVSYYAASKWADTPARMLAPLLVQAFERIDAWEAVVQLPSAVRGDYRIDSDHLAIRHEFFYQPSRVRLTLRTQLIDLQHLRPIGTKEFEISETASSEDAYGGVVAANRAVARLIDEVAAWLKECMEEAAGDCRGPLGGGSPS
jgi:cholesterol transport system auxiliary component